LASITSGTPWPLASGAKFLTRKVTDTAPITGTRITRKPQGEAGVWMFAL
jgi:hypothetical protein